MIFSNTFVEKQIWALPKHCLLVYSLWRGCIVVIQPAMAFVKSVCNVVATFRVSNVNYNTAEAVGDVGDWCVRCWKVKHVIVLMHHLCSVVKEPSLQMHQQNAWPGKYFDLSDGGACHSACCIRASVIVRTWFKCEVGADELVESM